MNARPVLWAGAAEAAAAVRRQCPQAAADALARAGEICEHTFLFRDHWEMEPTREPVHFDGPVVWDAVPAGDPEWIYALNRHTIFVNLGKAWQYTGQARYLNAFVSLLEDWLNRVPRTPASENTTWRALEAGLRPENWLRALGLFGQGVPEPLCRRIDESLARHGAYLAEAHGPFQRLSNWGAIQSHGLFLIGLWLGRADWQELALGRLAENLRHAVLPDGVQWEQSPMYHCEVLHAVLDTLLLAQRNGVPVPPALPEKALAMCRALAVWAAPDRTILPQGDSDVIDAGDLLAAGALLFRDPLLAAAARGPVCEETLWDFGPDAAARLDALPAAWPETASQALAVSGNYILRTGWGKEDAYVHFHAGSLGGGHGHADLLHIDVYHGGEAVLTDAGRLTYVDGELRRTLKGPAAHNTLRLDGEDFTSYRGTWEWGPIAQPLPARARFAPQADCLTGGHLGYLERGAAVERRLVFLKPGLLVGADIVRAPDGRPHRAEQFFHFGPGVLPAGADAAFWQGARTCAQLRWLSGQQAACFAAPFARVYNHLDEAPALRLEAPAAGVTALLWVLSLGGPCEAERLPVCTGAGQPLPAAAWQYDKEAEAVVIPAPEAFHEYTVSFLAYLIWDPVHMYNAVVNGWTDVEHQIPFDVRQPKTHQYTLERLRRFLESHPYVDVVRFTTFFHLFTLVFDELRREKYVDWYGYSASVSPYILERFEKEAGYPFRPEYIIDQGYHNNQYRVPSKEYKDFMAFQQREVNALVREMTDIVHEYGKEAMMFLGDHWIGTEPFGDVFASSGVDAIVGSVGNGSTLRLISDIPGVKYTEGRFLPYFFPDTFHEGGDPVREAKENWVTARRAILRKPIDRIGYGGYLKLALQFPDFIDYVESVCNEFRELYDNIKGTTPYCVKRVGVLNCWGKVRSWGCHMVHHALYQKQNYSYAGVIEALSGAPFDVQFLSFEDVKNDPSVLDGIDVLINVGDADTAHTGGIWWEDPAVSSAIRRFVWNGGGLIGVGEPGGHQYQGRFLQLAGVLGVEKETGFTLNYDKYNWDEHRDHFILADCPDHDMDFGEGKKSIYALEGTEILIQRDKEVQLAAHDYGQGRGVYISGLPYSFVNSRALYRAILWAAHSEDELHTWFSSNYNVEVHAYVKNGKYCVVNNTYEPQDTTVYRGDGSSFELHLDANEIKWYTSHERAPARSGVGSPQPAAAGLAADGVLWVHPLWDEHLYRPGVGGTAPPAPPCLTRRISTRTSGPAR